MNLRPSGYEPDELPGCSTPRQFFNFGGPARSVFSSHLRCRSMGGCSTPRQFLHFAGSRGPSTRCPSSLPLDRSEFGLRCRSTDRNSVFAATRPMGGCSTPRQFIQPWRGLTCRQPARRIRPTKTCRLLTARGTNWKPFLGLGGHSRRTLGKRRDLPGFGVKTRKAIRPATFGKHRNLFRGAPDRHRISAKICD